MNKTKLIALLAFALSTGFALETAAKQPLKLAYGYGHTIDMQMGWAGSPYSINGANGMSNGFIWDLRYTYFISRHWGPYIQFGTSSFHASEQGFFKSLNSIEGGKYKYSLRDKDSYSFYGNAYNSDIAPLFTAGAAYRYDFGRWSLRPRVGIGVAQCFPGSLSYVRYPRTGDNMAPEYFSVDAVMPSKDYLIDDAVEDRSAKVVSFVCSSSLQMTYTVGSHFFFSVEAGIDLLPGKVEYCHRKYYGQEAYNPRTWAEAISQSDLRGLYSPDWNRYDETRSSKIVGSQFYAKLGLGWNIGWNRNYNNYYRKRR